MNRRKPKNYTIWIARTGGEPIVLSLRPLVILLAVGFPATLVVTVVLFFIHHNNQLWQRNSQLTEEAGSILEQVKALESTLTHLQERAKISQDGSEDAEAGVPEDAIEELEETEEFNSQPDDSTSDSVYPENQSDGVPDSYQSIQSGGMGGSIGAEGLLAAAKAKIPTLIEELEGEVEPALNEIIVRQEAKPSGIPLMAKDTEITSEFGFRPNPFGWGYEYHQGIDLVADYGSPVHVTASGTVTKAEWEPGYGNHVIVDHGYGLETLYAHLSDTKVKPGDRIDRHQIVGYLGNTGRSSGPHLHYSVLRNGQAVDPKKYLD